ncbi:MAG: ribonuclease Z [Mucilaginibacter polytrichastri]|nr:ribonuclease Z [Mucilaginibacter polytrichastri]
MRFDLTILGCSSATPIYNRNPTAQLLNCFDKYYLIDCGEGTQQQLLRFDLKSSRIDHIFISHLHGDHYLGLIGLLSSLHLNGRTKPLLLFAPPELKEIIELHFKYSETVLQYEIIFRPVRSDVSEVILENDDLIVETIILAHRIPCTGFLFRQKRRLRKVIREKMESLHVPHDYVRFIKRGHDFTDENGTVHPNAELTTDPDEPLSYAYCSDTLYNDSYCTQLYDVDLLYHESTFMHDMLDRAQKTFHTTALQAGEVALKCRVKRLLIGHFSARYKNLGPLLEEARSVFPQSELAVEGRTYAI